MTEKMKELAYRNLLEVFGQRDSEARMEAIRETYDENIKFYDPDEVVTGWDALNEKAQKILAESPGFVFKTAGDVQVSHNLAVLAWQFGPEGEEPVVRGLDISIVENGRIAILHTLIDTQPESS
ncbi:nuclear transport factor 2 family protein [Streptomyces sp. NPDC046870]|uniref:nuclear transport factor 2 family protein n=1 Tax=Streptomyces sp. NPDC046870 TaxID=3155135 RepID=UPI0034513FAD